MSRRRNRSVVNYRESDDDDSDTAYEDDIDDSDTAYEPALPRLVAAAAAAANPAPPAVGGIDVLLPPAAAAAVAAAEEPAPAVGGNDVNLPQAAAQEDVRELFMQILRTYNIEYIYKLPISQMATLALILVRSEEAQTRRPPDVQRLINDHRAHPPVDHDQQLNEFACIMDYLIKQKANIMGLYELLANGDRKVRIISLPDENGINTPDIFVFIPASLAYEICQGAAFRWFGDYRRFGGRRKHFEIGRYMFGLYSGRVYDTRARNAGTNGVLLRDNDVHFNAQGIDHRVVRQIVTGPFSVRDPARCVNLENANINENNHVFRLHRLTLVLASALRITVFDEEVLEGIGVRIPVGSKFDEYIVYRPLNDTNERREIIRALRVGAAHSLQCDGDHHLGYGSLYCHGLSCLTPESHRMNTCFIHVRRNAGHWCFGLHYSEYTGGIETNAVDTSFVERITFGEGGEALFDGEPIEETNLFDILQPLENWIVNVDCTCSSAEGGPCPVCG